MLYFFILHQQSWTQVTVKYIFTRCTYCRPAVNSLKLRSPSISLRQMDRVHASTSCSTWKPLSSHLQHLTYLWTFRKQFNNHTYFTQQTGQVQRGDRIGRMWNSLCLPLSRTNRLSRCLTWILSGSLWARLSACFLLWLATGKTRLYSTCQFLLFFSLPTHHLSSSVFYVEGKRNNASKHAILVYYWVDALFCVYPWG